MTPDVLIVAVAACLLAAVLAGRFVRSDRWSHTAALGFCCVAGIATVAGFATREPIVPEAEVTGRPIELPTAGYVTSATCQACHAHEYHTWNESYHSKMTQVATPQSVVSDFDEVTLSRFGKTFRLQQRGAEFWIEMDDPMAMEGTPARRVQRQVLMTTGSHNMQLYWYGSGHSRVTGLLPFAYQIAEKEWLPRLSAFVLPPSDQIMAEFGQWNMVCNKCHATNSRPRFEKEGEQLRAADTHVSELGIACESCHGPAEGHVAANRNPVRRYSMHLGGESDPTITNPARLPHVLSTQVCGQCHGHFDDVRRGERAMQYLLHGFEYRPGDDLEQSRKASRSGWDEQFWSDGVIRIAGREYNSLIGSGCYERGEMSCVSCHVMHQSTEDPRSTLEWANDQLRHDQSEDQMCLQCHPSFSEDVVAHTHHPIESEGSRCMNCHMPYTTYGLLKGIRNHHVDSPSVATTLATGRPNACNQCHLDRSLGWTADSLAEWYGIEKPILKSEDRSIAASVRWTLEGDAAQRALMAWTLGWKPAQEASGSTWIPPYLAQLLDDPYDAVRIIARRSLQRLPGFERIEHDLVGPPEEHERAMANAFARWKETMLAPGDRSLESVLIGPDGKLREALFQTLLRRRNDREVKLLE